MAESAFDSSWSEGTATPSEQILDEARAFTVSGAADTPDTPDTAAVKPKNTPLADTFGLTSREREVLRLLTSGQSNRAIAERLIVSPSTVDFHVSNILSKLGVSSRTEAVAFAIQHSLVE